MKSIYITFFSVVLIVLVIIGWQRYLSQRDILSNFETSENITTDNDTINNDVNGESLQNNDVVSTENQELSEEVMVTKGVKHLVPLDDILGGGPPKDGIPSIDEPKFVSVSDANSFLKDEEPGIAYSQGGIDRFYPYQILVWHEIVNDTINGRRVLVTYCPLCLSGVVYDPLVGGERVEFGTSGKLWNSNLVMYDRKTGSYWSQILGQAIVGDETGRKLTILPSDQIRYGDWKKIHGSGEVLSKDTGAFRLYGNDPYGDYYTNSDIYFPVANKDSRLDAKDFVLGIVINGKAKAYWPEAIKSKGTVEDKFGGKIIVAKYEKDIDAVRLFEKGSDGKLTRVNPLGNFWFSWVAAYPETELYK